MGNLRSKRVLVTGANGFVGAHLMARMLDHGAEVTGVIRASSNCWRFDVLGITPQLLTCDLENDAQVTSLLGSLDVDIVFHLATERDRQKLALADAQGQSANAGANIMQAMAGGKRRTRFVTVGTGLEVLNPTTGQPYGLHGKSKYRELMALQSLAETLDMPYSPTRTHYVYGPLQSADKLIPVAIKAALEGRSIALTGPDVRKRCIYVMDLVDALLTLLSQSAKPREVQLITSPQQVSNSEIVMQIATLMGKPIKIEAGEFSARDFDRADWALSAAGTPLDGWHPKTPLTDGLRACVEWGCKVYV